ncbi:hypothetical protein BDF19DRAFT_437256 [Syncephalis fuscata]|nr:hypothetical protein BDF19DRAFT_437256 [Syncephalis fuscata]
MNTTPMEPFLYTFASLVESFTDTYHVQTLARIYTVADPYFNVMAASVILMALCWPASLVTNHYSIVDRLWSLLPPIFSLYYLFNLIPALNMSNGIRGFIGAIYEGLWSNPRVLLVTLLIVIWGARLTFNYWRKGGYRWGEEDYRWQVVKAGAPAWAFQLLNLFFIVIYQLWLLAALTAPVYLCWKVGFVSWSWMDVVATAMFVGALVGETVADEQQWRFHLQKRAYEDLSRRNRRKSNEPISVIHTDIHNGFLTRGLWRYSRHPNFFCEQTIWCAVYLFGTAATGEWYRWDSAAVITLILLFQGSTTLTERITAGKYPAYAVYQRTTSRLMPWWPHSVAPKQHVQ